MNLLYDTQDPKQEQNALPCVARVFDLVLALGGTLSGEHGIGLAKRDYVTRALRRTAGNRSRASQVLGLSRQGLIGTPSRDQRSSSPTNQVPPPL